MIAISTLPAVLIVIGGWIAFGFLFALLIGKAIAKGQPPEHPTFAEPSPIEDFIEERRAAEARTAAAVRRAQARREVAGLPAARPHDRRGEAA